MKKFTRERVVPDHLGERLLRQFRQHPLGRVFLAVAREQQQRAGEPLLARVEELIDEVLFDADVAREHVRDESVGELGMLVQHPKHVALVDAQDRRRHHGRGRSHAQRLAGQAPLAKEIAGPEHGDDRLLACRRQHRELHAAIPHVEHTVRLCALREHDGPVHEPDHAGRHAGRLEEGLNVK